jgi:RimJ/RimL family protein N-acetyltransferase
MTSEIETTRLLLRRPIEADVRDLMVIHEDRPVVERADLIASDHRITVAWRNVAMMLGHWTLRGFGQWVVVEKETNLSVGCVGLFSPKGWPGIELGWLIRHSHTGNGYATEAAAFALDWAWRNVGTEHIISLMTPDDLASIRIAEKLGEQFEREILMNDVNHHMYGIRRQE